MTVVKKITKSSVKKVKNMKKEWKDEFDEIDISHLRGGHFTWNFEEKKPMSLPDKITWVLTAVNVAILISLVIKNV